MKNILLALTFITSFSLASLATPIYSLNTIDCEHCAKDHTCDDNCKKGEKSECCDKVKTAEVETDQKATPACCAKGKKSCSKDAKKEEVKEPSDKS